MSEPNPRDPTLSDGDLARSLFPLDDHAGPAAELSGAGLDALLAGALDAAFGGGGDGGGGGAGDPQSPGGPNPQGDVSAEVSQELPQNTHGAREATPRPGPHAAGAAPVVRGAFALVLLASAALWWAQSGAPTAEGPPETAPPTDALPSASRSQPPPASGESQAPEAHSREPHSREPHSREAPALSDRVPPAARATEEPRRTTPASPPSAPADLLREANALRGAGRYRAAEQTYLRVVREHGASQSAYVARLAAAALRLERLGNPRGALSLYQTALRSTPNGALSPEARRGVANATRRLGQREAERRALRDYLAHHPRTGFAGPASARLQELEGEELEGQPARQE